MEKLHASDEPRPYWMPDDLDFDALPEQLQASIVAVVNPAYDELVLQASPGLEMSTGITIVHLLWLEIVDQIELGRQLGQAAQLNADASSEREKIIHRLLRIVVAKHKASGFLLRLNEFRQRGLFAVEPDPLAGPLFPPQPQPGEGCHDDTV